MPLATFYVIYTEFASKKTGFFIGTPFLLETIFSGLILRTVFYPKQFFCKQHQATPAIIFLKFEAFLLLLSIDVYFFVPICFKCLPLHIPMATNGLSGPPTNDYIVNWEWSHK